MSASPAAERLPSRLRDHCLGSNPDGISLADRGQHQSLIYRLDRLTGDVRVCIKQTPDDPHLLTCYKQGEPTRVSLN